MLLLLLYVIIFEVKIAVLQNYTNPSIHPSIVCNHFIIFMGSRGVFAGASPSCLWARAGNTLDKSPAHRRALHWCQRPPCKVPSAHQEPVGVQYLAEGHFDTQLSLALESRRPSDHQPTSSTRWAAAAPTALISLSVFKFDQMTMYGLKGVAPSET